MSHRFSTTYELIRRQAASAPTAPAIVAGGCEPLVYSRLLDQIHAVAATLRGLGVMPDDRVVLVIPNGPEAAVAFLAVTAAAAAAPLNPAYGEGEFAFFLEDLNPKLVIVDETLAASPAIAVAGQRQIPVARLRRRTDSAAGLFVLDAGTVSRSVGVLEPNPDAPALLLHTSGTTARPKLVPLTHANLCESAANIAGTLRLVPGDRCLNVMPLFHVHGLIGALLSSMHAGASVHCSPGFDAPRVLSTLIDSGATWYTAVPTMHQAVAARAAMQPELAARTPLRFIRSSSAALPPSVMAELEAQFRVPVVEAYGMTEGAHQIACNPLPPAARKPGSVGLAAGPDVAVMDAEGRLLARGEAGEIVIRGANVTRGYVNDPSPHTSRVAGWFRTGDVGRIDEEGYIFLIARAKELINRSGEKIAPAELEEVFLRHPAVAQAVVFAMPHPTLGEDVAAAVVLKAGAHVDETALRQFMADQVAPFKVPRRIVFLDEIPKGPTGKLRRIGLASQLGLDQPPPDAATGRPFVAPVSATEVALAAIWKDVLGIDRAGRDDDFFMLGGDSLLAAKVLERVSAAMKAPLSFLVFQESPTLEGMARAIDAVLDPSSGGEPADGPAQRMATTAPLSYAQERVRFLQSLSPGSPVYNRPLVLRIEGPLDADAITWCVRALLERHEALRAVFPDRDGEPVQTIAPVPDELAIARASVEDVEDVTRATALNDLLHVEVCRLFDLRTGPLFRPLLIRVAPHEHVLLLAMHHIVVDGLSARILVEEIRELYAARVERRPATLPAMGETYAGFAARQRRELDEGALAGLLGYWIRRLAGAPPGIELATDRPRPALQTYNGATLRVPIAPELSRRVEAVGRSQSCTPFMTFLAAFDVLLHRYSGATDLVVGTPVGGRTESGLEATVGLFVNTLAIRASVDGAGSFRHVLAGVRESVLGAFAHQALPFERLVEEIRPDRHLGRSPVFQVMFSFRPPLPERLEAAGVVFRPVEIDTHTAKFDLTLEVSSGRDGFRAAFEYNTDLFDRRTIEQMARHYITLLDRLSAAPDAPVSGLSMLGDEDRRLLDHWSERGAVIDGHPLVHELFEAQAASTPDAVAVTSGDESLSYADLDRLASRLARRLQGFGVGPEVVVGLCLERGADLLVGLLGILKAGGAYLPLDPDYPEDRLAYMLADSRAPIVVSQASLVGHLGGYAGRVVQIDAVDDETPVRGSVAAARPEAENLAYLIYTSGSTGVPKGVEIPHRALGNLVMAVRDRFGFDSRDVLLAVTSISFDIAGLELFVPITMGARVDIASQDTVVDPRALRAHVESIAPTVMQATPSMWHALVGEGWGGSPRLTILCGGEALSRSLAMQLVTRANRVWNVYGPTETTIWSAAHDVQAGDGPIPIGRPLANNELYVLDASGQPLPVGVRGELHIGGAGVARGYRGQPDLTAQRFVPDPSSPRAGARLYKTGDIVRYRPDGLLEFIGRADAQVKLRGHRIELGEVEAALQRLPEVRESAAAVRSLGDGDDRLVAYVLLHPERQLTLKQVRGELKRFLPQYMLPSALVVMPEFPRTANGKLDRRALAAPEEWRHPERREAPAGSPIEDVVCGLWCDLLGLDRVGRDESFFDLGGHSLLAARLMVRIREVLGVELPPASIFERPSVAEIAADIETARRADGDRLVVACEVRDAGVPVPLSLGQHRLWLLERLDPGLPTYNIASCLRVQGSLDVEVLERALIEVCRRHEALRTVFVEEDGTPRQVVRSAAVVEFDVQESGGVDEAAASRALSEYAQRPFDLSAGPLIRSLVVRRGEAAPLWLLVVHHIVADAWSLEVLYREVWAHYESIHDGLEFVAPPLPVQFGDFAIWEHRRRDDKEMARQLAYWKSQLAAPLPALHLPTDSPRRARTVRRGRRVTFKVPRSVEDALKGLGRRERTTPFMTFLAAFQTLLFRYSGQDDVLVGAPMAGRPARELEGVIGFFLNTVVFRGDLSENPSFRSLLARTRATALDAYACKDLPFERLVDELQPVRGGSDSPFFEVMFTLQDEWRPATGPGGLAVEPFPVDTGTAKCDLSLMLATSPRGLTGTLEYDADLFEPSTAAGLAACYLELLSAIAENPDGRLSDLRLQPEAERVRILALGRGADRRYPDCLVHELFESQADRTPDLSAIAFEGQRFSYRTIDDWADRLAWKLGELGLRPDSCVALLCERSPELIVGMLGVLKAGAAFLPLDPASPEERLLRLLRESGAAAVVTTSECPTVAAGVHPHVICVDDFAAPADVPPVHVPGPATPSDLAYVIYTSGSTGDPKAVGVEHRQLVNYVQGILETLDVSELPAGASWATLSSIAADLGHTAIFAALSSGGCLHVLGADRSADPVALGEYFRNDPIDCLKVVPSHFAALMASSDPACVVPRHRLVFGGEVLPTDLVREVQRVKPDTRIVNHYGPTETTVGALTYAVRTGEWPTRSVPIGTPLPNVQAQVVDTAGHPVPDGVVGELVVTGAGVARGYLNDADLTRERFAPPAFCTHPGARSYRTGDVVRRLASGDIEFLGRGDGQVKIHGHRIEVGEIEAALRDHPAIREAAVGVRDDGHRRLVAYVVADPAHAPVFSGHARYRLPNNLSVVHLNRNETDYLYEEIFERQPYVKFLDGLPDRATIVDVGANIGLFGLFATLVYRQPRVYAVEPNPSIVELLRANFALHGVDGTLVPCGLGERADDGQFTFFEGLSLLSGFHADARTEQATVSAFLRNQSGSEFDRQGAVEAGLTDELVRQRLTSRTFSVPRRTLSDLVDEHGIERIDLLKINVEKSELDVLRGIRPEHWGLIQHVVLEVDLDEHLSEVVRLLTDHGFSTHVEQDRLLASTALRYVWGSRSPLHRQAFTPSAHWPRRVERVDDPVVTVDRVRTFLAARLPDPMVPSAFVWLDRLPRTAAGKIDRRVLGRVALPAERADEFVEPRGEIEVILAAIWRDVLDVDRVGRHDNFFEHGGDSLLSFRFVPRALERGLRVTPRQLFQHQTLAELAAVVERRALPDAEAVASGVVPPTPIQRWFFEQAFTDPGHFTQARLLEASGDMDVETIRRAVGALVAHHDALRLQVVPAGGGRELRCPQVADVADVAVVDLRDTADEEMDKAVSRACEAVQASTNLERGPLFQAAILRLGGWRGDRLLLSAHHLVVDDVSWHLLLEDFETAYVLAREGREVRLPSKTASFKAWSEQLAQIARDRLGVPEADFWCDGVNARYALPCDFPRGRNDQASACTASVRIDAALTRVLTTEWPIRGRVYVHEVALAAWLLGVEQWTGERALRIDIEEHGRDACGPDLDVSRTVGWFTALYPLSLDWTRAADRWATLVEVQHRVAQCRGRSAEFGLLRYLRQDELSARVRALPRAETLFNFRGRLDHGTGRGRSFSRAPEPKGASRSPRQARTHVLELSVEIEDGSLRMTATWSEHLHRRATIEALLAVWKDEVENLFAAGQRRFGGDGHAVAVPSVEAGVIRS